MTQRTLAGGLAGLLLVCVFAAAWQTGEAGAKKSETLVKVKATAGPAVNDQRTIKLTLDIDQGWHIYANPVDHDMLASAQTQVEVKTDGKAVPAKIDYPKGKLNKDK